MKSLISVLFVFTLFSLFPRAGTAADGLKQAQQLIDQQKYDDAISILRPLTEKETSNAEAAVTLARAYHWKKDFPNAKKWYLRAAALNPGYKLEIVSLLDELEDSDEVIRLVEPEFEKGNRRPSLLGALLTAYERKGRKTDREIVAQALSDASYDNAGDRDYRNYILAYVSLFDGDTASAISYIKKIADRGYRVYARTSPKFAKLKDNPAFLKATE